MSELPRRVESLSDDEMNLAYDNALADYGLAVKYEHNAHLRPAIEARLMLLDDEFKRRGTQYRHRPPPPRLIRPHTPGPVFLDAGTCPKCGQYVEDTTRCQHRISE